MNNAFPADFDREIDRSATFSSKWEKYAGRDVLPFWVADMDFRAPPFIIDAVRKRLEHEVLGYTRTPKGLVEAFQGWLARTCDWTVSEEWLVWIPGVVTGFNLAARATAAPGGSILMPTPVYHHFLSAPQHAGQQGIQVPLVLDNRRWVMDLDALRAASRPHTTLFMLCNPQNPTGRSYSAAELTAVAELCLERNMVLCSDEIHCSLLLDESARHTPVASLSPEIADRSITLFAATKTYNIPGLGCAVAVIPNRELRTAFSNAMGGLVAGIGPLSYAASQAAYADTSDWLPSLLGYLRGNHARVRQVVGDRMTPVEATYLAWIDVRDLNQQNPGAYMERHGLGLSNGAEFGGPGFVRFNFACPRALLERGLTRLSNTLETASGGLNSPSA